MRRDSKLSVALHVLAHLAATGNRPMTSEAMAAHLRTNPVVIRRSLAGLREAGIVASAKGHGGGWTLARPAAAITLGAVYTVFGEHGELLPRLEPDSHGCQIDAAVRTALDGFYAEANALLMNRLDAITLADLTADIACRLSGCDAEARHIHDPSGQAASTRPYRAQPLGRASP